MERLRPAGLLKRLVSGLFPKRLSVEVRTQAMPDGTIEIVPIYTLDGQVVPPDALMDHSTKQRVMGHKVSVSPQALTILKETRGKRTRISKHKAADFIQRIADKGVRLRAKGRNTAPRVSSVAPEIRLELREDDSLQVTSQLVAPNGVVVEKPSNFEATIKDDGWYTAGEDLYRITPTGGATDSLIFSSNSPQVLTGDDVPRLLQDVLRSETAFSAVEKNDRLRGLSIYGEKHESRIRVSGDRDAIRLEPQLVYFGRDNQAYQPTTAGIDKALANGGGFNRIDEGWIEIDPGVVSKHKECIEELREQLGNFENIRGQAIPDVLQRLRDGREFSTPWAVYATQDVQSFHHLMEKPADASFALNIIESDSHALLELDARYDHERFRLSHNDVRHAIDEEVAWLRRGDAWVQIDRDRFETVQRAIETAGLELTPSGIRFPASRRDEVLAIFSRLGSIEHSAQYAKFLEQLVDFEKIEPVSLPTSLRSSIQLYSYQKHGYDWLAFLRRYGLNGILADDMGLGKTLQTLAVVRLEQELSDCDLPSLIICPTSLVKNWGNEAQKFFSGFTVLSYSGGGRKKTLRAIEEHLRSLPEAESQSRSIKKNLVIVTTYGIAVRDRETLNRIPWLYVIIDEAHHIKNPSAKRTRAIKTINGQHKVALTGTPIQNRLDELWSLFDYLMPGYLGTRTQFREQYTDGDRVNWDAVHDRVTGLPKRIHPFLLRRLKQDVQQELPEKITVTIPVELQPAQVVLYKEAQMNAVKRMFHEVDSQGIRHTTALILRTYMQMRMICNHPAVVAGSEYTTARVKDSGKLIALRELIVEVKEGDHRALLFCQSTKMLDVIQAFFEKWGITFLRLDGSTPASDRQNLVDKFNGDSSITAFLISTLAGGTGLNLVGADTVIFYDHDWNPANDNQAQDRAHRIGQTKKVTVYKLVTSGTIEQRIIERQEMKQTLADQIVGSDSEGFKELTREDLISLFDYHEQAT